MQFVDAQLVELARAGDRDAFAQIVRRYQNLVCSIAYGMTGSLQASEEVAQESFIAAWQSLAQLREPDKLRQWISGIVRNLAKSRGRVEQREVLNTAEAVDATHADSDAPDPAANFIAREEVDLLDRTLQSLPSQYREPLVLYYREQQSVAAVAELLELAPNTVKQRLARGRELLRSEIAAVVERGLLRSAPSNTFTFGVLAALPVLSASAKTTSLTLATAKGVSAMNAAGLGGLAGAIFGPIAGLLGGWFGYRMSMRAAGSEQERQFIKKQSVRFLLYIGAFVVAITGLMVAQRWLRLSPMQLTLSMASLMVSYVAGLFALIFWTNRRISLFQRQQGSGVTGIESVQIEAAKSTGASSVQSLAVRRSYRSRMCLLGLPLVSVEFAGGQGLGAAKPAIAKGWIAIGDIAVGGLLGFGNLAVGPIAMGAVSVGLIGMGGLGLGVLAFGGLAVGGYAAGGLAFGWTAFGGVSIAWHAAVGGLALAHDIAVGGYASALHANDEVAKSFMNESVFLQAAKNLNSPAWVIVLAVMMLPIYLVMRHLPKLSMEENQSDQL